MTPDHLHRRRSTPSRPRWPVLVFLVAVVALMPRSLAGQATYGALDMLETQPPYRAELDHLPEPESPLQTDQVEHLPLTLAMMEQLRQGSWQLWEPRIGVGTPTASAYPWLLSPFNLPFLVLPDWYANTLHAALGLLVGQALMYLFLRRLRIGTAAATFGAVAYAFTGTNIMFLQRPFGAVWILPGLLWAVHRAVEQPSRGRVLAVGGFVAWCWFEGFPAVFFHSIYVAGAWAAWLAVRHGREPVRRVLRVAAGFVWGVLVAMVGLLPFVAEISARGILDLRSTDASTHLDPVLLLGLVDLSVNGDPTEPGSWWTGANAFESVSIVGSIVVALVVLGLAYGLLRRLRLTREGRDAWLFFAFLAPLVALLVFVGTPLLGLVYEVPGIAHNAISRSRYLLALGLVVLASLHLDAVLQPAPAREGRVPRAAAAAAVCAWLGVGLAAGPAAFRSLRASAQLDELLAGMGTAVLWVVAGATIVVLAARHRDRIPAAGAATVLAALVFAQVAQPLRHFTPEVPVGDFYPELDAHRELAALGGGRYRFASSGFGFYPNSAQLLDLYDLRGIVLYDDDLRRLLEAASPETFTRDRLKQVMLRDEWQLESPIYDDLALRHFALSTAELPYGQLVPLAGPPTTWVEVDSATVAIDLPAGREVAGAGVALRPIEGCDAAELRFDLVAGGTVISSSFRRGWELGGDATFVALVGGDATVAPETVAVTWPAGCRIALGMAGDDPSATVILDDPDDAVRLVSTEQAWIYERPTAKPIISVATDWRWFAGQDELIDELVERGGVEAGTAFLVGDGAPPAGATASILRSSLGSSSAQATVRADGPAVVVLAQHAANGWRVRVDGEAAPLLSVDGALLGVAVGPGTHEVRFSYRPRHLFVGAALTGMTLSATLAVGAAVAWRERRARRRRT